MVELRGVRVWLESESEVLEEYEVERTTAGNKHSVSSYVISEVGKEFSVSCENLLDDCVCFTISVDGTITDSRLCDSKNVRSIFGTNISEELCKPYKFAVLNVIDKAPDLKSTKASRWDRIGVIEVQICRVQRTGKPSTTKYSAPPELRNNLVPERSMKLAAHRITFGDAQKSAPVISQHIKWLDPRNRPFAVFQFKYRPQALLQAQGIIPAPSSNGVKGKNKAKRKRSERSKSRDGPSRQIRRLEEPSADDSQSSSEEDIDEPFPLTKLEELDDEGLPDDVIAQMQMMERRLMALEARNRRDRRTIQELRGSTHTPVIIDLTED